MPSPRTGSKKLAPKGAKTRELTQYCIDGYLVNEVLESLPKGIEIVQAEVIMGKAFNKHKMIVPNKLKKMGVNWMREIIPANELGMTFDSVSKSTIKIKVEAVAKELFIDPASAYFKYIVLSNGECTGKFCRTTKEIRPHEEDLRKKLTVLGLKEASGKTSSLIGALGAKKYVCKFVDTIVRTIICSS